MTLRLGGSYRHPSLLAVLFARWPRPDHVRRWRVGRVPTVAEVDARTARRDLTAISGRAAYIEALDRTVARTTAGRSSSVDRVPQAQPAPAAHAAAGRATHP
jgi:hypothetical protein